MPGRKVRGKPEGWRREPRRHREAYYKGRRDKHIVDKGSRWKISKTRLNDLRREYIRTTDPASVRSDLRQSATRLFDPSDPRQVKAWKNYDGYADLDGVDTALHQMLRVKLKARKRAQDGERRAKAAVDDARARVKKVRESKAAPEAKKAEEKSIFESTKKLLDDIWTGIRDTFAGAKDVQRSVAHRHHEKWSSERKKRAEAVANTVGTSVIEADALIQRAQRAGYDYDVVRWDEIQGKDLTFSERLEKLEHTIHKETYTKTEESQEDWRLEQEEAEFNAHMDELERRMNEEFGGDYEAMERDRSSGEELWGSRPDPAEAY